MSSTEHPRLPDREDLLQHLAGASQMLAEDDDLICLGINAVEEDIEGANCRVQFWWPQRIAVASGERHSSTYEEWVDIGWSRIGKRWRLAARWAAKDLVDVETWSSGHPDADDYEEKDVPVFSSPERGAAKPLVEMSREIRTEAWQLLDQFLAALVDHVDGVARAVNQSVHGARDRAQERVKKSAAAAREQAKWREVREDKFFSDAQDEGKP